MFEVPEEAQLKIGNNDGDLTVRGTDQTSLRLIGSRAASKVTVDGKTVYISSADAALEIEVPAKVVSMELAQSDGNVSIEELNADLVARVNDGNISISRVTGKIEASVEDGNASLMDIKSDEIGVRAQDGSISLSMLPTVEEGSVSLSTDKGPISLSLPPDSRCEVSANAPGGNISHTLPPESTEIMDETDTYLSAKLNGGGAEFVLSAKMGDIIIKA
jgi:hypothetical protein